MKLLDGKLAAGDVEILLKFETLKLKRKPKLAIILPTKDSASQSYLIGRQKVATATGMEVQVHRFDKIPTQKEIIDLIHQLNEDNNVDGIMVDRPFPKNINEAEVNNAIHYLKDVEGVTTMNIGLLCQKQPCHVPPTAAACLYILKRYDISLTGKNVVILGRSPSVGKPLIQGLLHENATVTICHSYTQKLPKITQNADVLIVAIGKSEFINEDYLDAKQVVIDVGIHYNSEGKLIGDVNEEAKQKVTCATPTPGGVGPVTNYMLFMNLVSAYKWRNNGN